MSTPSTEFIILDAKYNPDWVKFNTFSVSDRCLIYNRMSPDQQYIVRIRYIDDVHNDNERREVNINLLNTVCGT